ncbi:MAG TPA: nitroreductase/quinone reductase family protein [Streptosporangiaceae bacterium]|nr:nitroreductase/quinone reductase family protein [Streptosporangiaceae bacterium]
MDNWPISAKRLRAMYANGRADSMARRLARAWAAVFSLGLAPQRWVTLEVTGRRSGRLTRFPLGMARLDGRWYLVPMLGEQCNWVQNVRAAGGLVTLRHGRARRCRLAELPVSERAPVLRQYLRHVPGARPHIPVARDADAADFAAVAPLYPVFLVTSLPEQSTTRSRTGGGRLPRRRRWQWIAVGITAVMAIVVAAVASFIELGPSAAPLGLPQGRVSAPAGPLAGTWQIGGGSLAGFRLRESALGLSNYVGGQTTAVTGTIVISGHTVTAASFRINLTTVKVNGKTESQFADSLGTRDHPVAMFTLTRPVALNGAFTAGRTMKAIAVGQLAMNGSEHSVTVTLTGRRNGTLLQTAGFIPVPLAHWHISQPAGFGPFGTLAAEGDAEFLLILHRQ